MKRNIVGLCMLLCGCGATSGFLAGSVTQVQVSKPGFNIIGTATGRASATSALCIIPVGDGELYRSAMSQLRVTGVLKANQTFINVRADVSNAFYIFACVQTLTLSADIIEFNDVTSTQNEQHHITLPKRAETQVSATCSTCNEESMSSCNPPWYIDDAGVKHFKRACIPTDQLGEK